MTVVQDVHDVHTDELIRFADEYHSLVPLGPPKHRFTAGDAIAFMVQTNSLKLIEFQVKNRLECDRLLNQLDNE